MKRAGQTYRFAVSIVLLVFALLPLPAGAQEAEGEPFYRVTMAPFTAADDPAVVARELTAAHGGTVVGPVTGETFVMRLSETRARAVSTDPRIASLARTAPVAGDQRRDVATEAVSWGSGVAYAYDGSGNIKSIGADTFVYDAAGRLVQGDTDGVRRNYEYDAFGNRTTCIQSAGTPAQADCQWGFSVNASNNRMNGVTYDAAGNVTALGAHTYTYDALNMQTRDASGTTAREYLYTADDERIAVYDVGQSWRWTIRATDGKVLREFTSANGANGSLGTSSWQWTKDHIWRDGLLLASRQPVAGVTTTYHYHLDHLGSPRRVTDGSDRIVGIHDYMPFGPEKSGAQHEPSASTLQYTGHERDRTGGYETLETLDYMHARFYSGTLGRFLSVDPVLGDPRFPQSWNRYTYALNNPLRFIDPSGQYVCQGTEEECAQVQQRLDEMRQNANELHPEHEARAALQAILDFYGAADEENDVIVNISDQNRLGSARTIDGVTTIRLNLTQAAKLFEGSNANVELGGILAHEGQHGLNQRALGHSPSFLAAVENEVSAYTAQAYVNLAAGVRSAYGLWHPWAGMNRHRIEESAMSSVYLWCSQPGAPCQ